MHLSEGTSANLSTAPWVGIGKKQLRRAISRGEIYPAFQPIVALNTGAVSGFEVLARWQDKKFGTIPPSYFITIAEQTGLIGPLMAKLIESACSSANGWGGLFQLAFNISPLQFQDATLPPQIEEIATRTGFSASRIQIELTEGTPIEDFHGTRELVKQLQGTGVQVILDDFGTGFSSLARLQSLPFDGIKIDASFVQSMTTARESRKIISAIIGLGESLQMSVVAEGIETDLQAQMLTDLGCDFGQGFFFGRPSRAQDIALSCMIRRHIDDVRPDDGAATLSAVEEGSIATIDRDGPDGALGDLVGDANTPVVEEARDGAPALQHVVDDLRNRRLGRELCPILAQPSMQSFARRPGPRLADG